MQRLNVVRLVKAREEDAERLADISKRAFPIVGLLGREVHQVTIPLKHRPGL